MARISHLHCARCQIRYTVGSNQAENTYAYSHGVAAITAVDLLNLATELWSTVGVKTQNILHNAANFREVHCQDDGPDPRAQATYAIPQPAPGAQGAGVLASNEAAQLTTRTGFIGYGQHGAKRYSPFSESHADGNTLSSTIIDALISIALSVLASRVSGTFTPVVLHNTTDHQDRLLQALSTDNNVDSQKSRLNGRGR